MSVRGQCHHAGEELFKSGSLLRRAGAHMAGIAEWERSRKAQGDHEVGRKGGLSRGARWLGTGALLRNNLVPLTCVQVGGGQRQKPPPSHTERMGGRPDCPL